MDKEIIQHRNCIASKRKDEKGKMSSRVKINEVNELRNVELVKAIKTTLITGSVTREDPAREEIHYWALDGKYIGCINPEKRATREP